jgi:hypothetical protein
VIDLAARRRRRNAAAVLAGAAAVIVAGFTMGQVIDVGANDDSGSASTADAGAGRDDAAKDEDRATAPEAAPGAGNLDTSGGAAVLRLTSTNLARDITDQLGAQAGSQDGPGAVRDPAASAFTAVGCTPIPPTDEFGLGDFFPALYDDVPAVLALRPPAGGTQQADVLECGTAELLASVTIAPR